MRAPWCAVALLSLLVAGCGDDDDNTAGPDPSTGGVNEAAAGEMARTTLDATALAAGGDGEAASFSLLATGFSAFSLVTPAGQPPFVPDFLEPNVELFSRAGGDGCDCGANSCNFVNCDNGSGSILNGTISWTTTTLDCNYTVAGNQAGFAYSFSIFADLDFTANSIDGVLTTAGDSTTDDGGTPFIVSWNSEITFNNVTFTLGSPTGGTITVVATVTAGGETFNGSGTVTF